MNFIKLTPTEKQQQLLDCNVQEVLYGGAAGGGKSVALLMAADQYLHIKGYNALLLRRSLSDLFMPGALIDLAHEYFSNSAAEWSEAKKQWKFPSGATLTFGYLDTENDKYRYQGSAFQFIGFDELTQFTESQYLYLFSRNRKSKTVNVPCRIFSTSNPGGQGHEWVKKRFVDDKTAGRLFIPSNSSDNPYLDHEEYEKCLNNLDPVTRRQLLNGDWDILPSGNFFSREKFLITGDYPRNNAPQTVRYWDLAASNKLSADYTAGVKMCEYQGQYWILDVIRHKGTPAEIELLIKQTAVLDGNLVKIFMEQEPGSSGLNVISHYSRNILPGFTFKGIKTTGNKVSRSQPFAAAVDNLNVRLVRGAWNNSFIDECVIFPQDNYPDDMVDAASGAFQQLSSVYAVPWIHNFKVNRVPEQFRDYMGDY